MAKKKIPLEFKKYFWDVDFEKLDPDKKPYFIIQRMLDMGDVEAVRWISKNFDSKEIKYTLTNLRGYSLKSASFWATYYQIPLEKVKCFQQPYLSVRRSHWPY